LPKWHLAGPFDHSNESALLRPSDPKSTCKKSISRPSLTESLWTVRPPK
jgi:hypothetical protein